MSVRLYMDVHVPQSITDQLRRRGVEVVTAVEDQADRLPDEALLDRARARGRFLFTQDLGFKALAGWHR